MKRDRQGQRLDSRLRANDEVQPEGGVLRNHSTGIHFVILEASEILRVGRIGARTALVTNRNRLVSNDANADSCISSLGDSAVWLHRSSKKLEGRMQNEEGLDNRNYRFCWKSSC